MLGALWEGSPDAYGSQKSRKACRYHAYVPDHLSVANLDFERDFAALVVMDAGGVCLPIASPRGSHGVAAGSRELVEELLRVANCY